MDENGARFRNKRNASFDTIGAINNYRNVRVAVLLLLFRNGNTRDKTERCQGNRIMLPFFFICFAEEEEEEHRRKIWWLLRDQTL
jgi:hypothetical protein